MTDRFDCFVVLAGMRTGSNFLEANLNAIDGLCCHGEIFNPHFVGYPKQSELLGIDRDARDADPHRLIEAIRHAPGGLGGFRLFHDHDQRAMALVLRDPRCAKIVLTRNPLDSYISWKIARETGQWKLTDIKRRKAARVDFDAGEFERHLEAAQSFQQQIQSALQVSGQTAFHIGYDDLQSVEVLNGLAHWLGAEGRLDRIDRVLKPQNPGAVADKVSNPEAIGPAIAGLDRFDLSRTPEFEPRRGPAVPTYVAAAEAGLFHMPIKGGAEDEIADWLAALDGVTRQELHAGMTQKQLRQWMRAHPGHRGFTVVRHPVARAHHVFCERILSTGSGAFLRVRETLRRQFGLKLPDGDLRAEGDMARHRQAFEVFLAFVRSNLAGQTAIRTDGAWATQSAVLGGFAAVTPPDFVLREEELAHMLPILAESAGRDPATPLARIAPAGAEILADIYDEKMEELVSDVYQRDYVMFGFGPWRPGQAA